ncbi:MAG TPA: ATP-binding cassette domain-containing protein [Burkholderiales bacterium]|nr:ATP-binding cassette domain-containing protein [Burkholderiales bacterium]
MAEVALRTVGLSRSFGGVAAVSGVSLECRSGSVHALVGPGGAGKTTLIDMLAGELAPSAGRIELFGVDVTGLPPERIARRGVGRSYQKTSVLLRLSAFENCRLAAQSRLTGWMRLLRRVERYHEVNAAAARALAAAGLADRGDELASALSRGEQRRLEIAMTIATAARVLLLDEPLAGMGAAEAARMLALIRGLKERHAILLVEQDMDSVFAVADVLSVMVDGAVRASGRPAEIRASRQAHQRYPGV